MNKIVLGIMLVLGTALVIALMYWAWLFLNHLIFGVA